MNHWCGLVFLVLLVASPAHCRKPVYKYEFVAFADYNGDDLDVCKNKPIVTDNNIKHHWDVLPITFGLDSYSVETGSQHDSLLKVTKNTKDLLFGAISSGIHYYHKNHATTTDNNDGLTYINYNGKPMNILHLQINYAEDNVRKCMQTQFRINVHIEEGDYFQKPGVGLADIGDERKCVFFWRE